MLPWFFLLLAQTKTETTPLPTFEQFAVTESFTGPPAKPILNTPGDRFFRTMIRKGAAKGPNFAGHHTIAVWGCGTSCISGLWLMRKMAKFGVSHLAY